jgi:hypothetical protein
MPIVLKDHSLSSGEVAMLATSLREALESYETKRAILLSKGEKIAPWARDEDLWLVRAFFNRLIGGKATKEELLKMVSALPTVVGSVPILKGELGGWLGVYYTTRVGVDVESGEKVYVPVALCRKGKVGEYRLYEEVADALDGDDPEEHGYTIKTDGAGFITCPGWSEVDVTRKGSDIVRVTVGAHHACSHVGRQVASEAWHAWRCPVCKSAMDRYRGVRKAKVANAASVVKAAILRKKIRLSD